MTTDELKRAAELLKALDKFRTHGEYHPLEFPGTTLHITDGVRFLADRADGYFILDAIAQWQQAQAMRGERYQVFTLTQNSDHSALLVCEDGDSNVLARNYFARVDFLLPAITLLAMVESKHSAHHVVVMLRGEV